MGDRMGSDVGPSAPARQLARIGNVRIWAGMRDHDLMRCLILAGVSFCCWIPVAASAQDVQPCDEVHVIYEKYVPLESEIRMTIIRDESKPTDNQLEKSPQGTRWFTANKPDFTKNGPWTTNVLVGDQNGTLMKLVFPNHGSSGVTTRWINDQLLFLSVWPGRIVSIDLILNVETAKFIYSEKANYRLLTQPCK
jgi:hypothetical protein